MRDIVATIQSDQYRLITAEPDGRARRAGRPRHRQDGGRPPPRVLAPLHAPRAAAARARRRAEPDLHGLRLARPADARRGGGRAAGRHRAASTGSRSCARRSRTSRGSRATRGCARSWRARSRSRSCRRRRSSYTLVDGVYIRVRERDVASLLEEALEAGAPLGLARDRFRMAVLRRFYERYGELFGPRALRSFDELESGAAARRLPHALARPRPAAAAAGEARRAAPHVAGRARGGVGGRARRRRAEAPPARPAAPRCPTCAGATRTCRCSTRRGRCSTARRARTGT